MSGFFKYIFKGDTTMTRQEIERKVGNIGRNLEMLMNELENIEEEVEDDNLYDEVSAARESMGDSLDGIGRLQSFIENNELSDSNV